VPIHGLNQHVRKEIRIRWCCRTNSEGRHRSSIAPVAGLRRGPPADERAFLDYLLSEASQRYFAEQTSEYPMIAGIAVTAGLPELSQLSTPPDIDPNDMDSLQETIVMISESGLAP
jgi:iron(III) transport system substrate-binding protein